MKELIKKNYWIFALLLIFLFSFWIRSFNITPDNILGFDPTFQYRFTKYVSDWGHIPNWDELTYYSGRSTTQEVSPLMLYITAFLHLIFQNFGFSLLTTASYASAFYGALIAIPAFFLIKRLAGKEAGLLGAFLIGTAPQILIRTFGSSYDTDQMALLFILVNFYLGLRFLQDKTIANFCWVTLGILASVLAWAMSIYAFLIIIASSVLYFAINIISKESESRHLTSKIKNEFSNYKKEILGLIGILAASSIIGIFLNADIIGAIFAIIGFALKPEKWIVNISIAELQPFNIFNLEGWIFATGRFITGDTLIDSIILLTIAIFTIAGLSYNYKKDNRKLSFLLAIFSLGIYTTFRGIRFTEFSSVIFLVVICSGFGYILKYLNNDKILKSLALGLGILFMFIALSIGIQYGQSLGPGTNSNWDLAWEFLKTETPKDSIVGTWWDPGHMIAALAERRNFADGAHCGTPCLYTINDRITDLGKIMATSNESESIELIKKYKGTSSKVYWIASDDLISKYQWLQYFGTGCDARLDPKCELYQLVPQEQTLQNQEGNTIVRKYSSIYLLFGGEIPVPVYVQEGTGYIIENVINYDASGKVLITKIPDLTINDLVTNLKPLTDQLGFTVTDQKAPLLIWVGKDFNYISLIPGSLQANVFTKMFFFEGQGLNHFKQVFRNEQVKIYEVIF